MNFIPKIIILTAVAGGAVIGVEYFSGNAISSVFTTTPAPVVEHLVAVVDPLTAYPTGTRIKLSSCMGVVSPAFQQMLELPVSAQIVLKFDGRSDNFKKGQTWAEIDPERLKINGEQLAIQKKDIDRKNSVLDAKSQVIQLRARLREIDRSLAIANMPEPTDPTGKPEQEAPEMQMLRDNAEKSKTALANEKAIITQRLATLEEAAEEREAGKEAEYRLRKMDYDRLMESAALTVPCDATVTLLFEPKDGLRTYPVRAGTPFARIIDSSRFFVAIPVSGQSWRGVAPEQLIAQVRIGSGAWLEARFTKTEQGKFLGRDEQLYLFEFRDASRVRGLVGGMVSVDIMQTIPHSRLIPKLDLLCKYPEKFQTREWRDAVPQIFPDVAVIGEGESEIAVAPLASLQVRNNVTSTK